MSGHAKSSRPADLPTLPPIPSSQHSPSDDQDHGQSTSEKLWDQDHGRAVQYRFLSPTEWTILAHGIGGVKDAEHHSPVHPHGYFWPPKGMPQGLYRDVVFYRVKSLYFFHAASVTRWTLLIIQLLLGATLTALGSFSVQDGVPITALGAANTIVAGLLALLHNSGLPDRYRYDMAEFEALEDHLMKLLDTGIVPADMSIEQVLAECYDAYHLAKATVTANMPATYMPGRTLRVRTQGVGAASPSVPVVAKVPAKTVGEKIPSAEEASKP